jgi:adenylate kinase
MRFLIFGAPGSGKGTQASKIAETYMISHIDFGTILRDHLQKNTKLGKEIAKYNIEKGNLIPDDLAIEILEDRLKEKDAKKFGFVLEGFPRTLAQGIAIDNFLKKSRLKLDAVININVDEDLLVKRLMSRRVCANCGESYNLLTNPPKQDDICDKCGGKLVTRDDDKEQVIRKRFRVFKAQTEPAINFFRKMENVIDIDGNRSVDEVFIQIKQKLDKMVK